MIHPIPTRVAFPATILALAALACEAAEPARTTQATPTEAAPATTTAKASFIESGLCARCHSYSPNARALTTATGDDASPHGTWSATTMANAFRDPYWRAQMASEIEAEPAREREIEALCFTCHAPMARHGAVQEGREVPTFDELAHDPLALDGVSCTVCHRAQPDGLGTPASFSGRLKFREDGRAFGPFRDPAPGPMRMHTGLTPTFSEHISESALCGACHTLYTRATPEAKPFLEQAVYLEWRNSDFNDEGGQSAATRTCQQCHMPDLGSMRIARMPPGRDFNIATRDNVRGHSIVGGNAFLLDLYRANREELGVTASEAALQRTAAATRAQLAHSTAKIEITSARRDGRQLEFDVRVENLTGHKFPSGYPSRRAWLDVEVRSGRTVVFESGGYDAEGRLVGVADEFALEHHDRIDSPAQVAVYEMVALDAAGQVTTSLAAMVSQRKDTRLLPRGWKHDGPHASETAPVGIGSDDDFVDGSDVVTYAIELPEGTTGSLTLIAQLLYQPIPPAWAAGLRTSRTAEAETFLRMYDAAKPTPESIALTVEVVE